MRRQFAFNRPLPWLQLSGYSWAEAGACSDGVGTQRQPSAGACPLNASRAGGSHVPIRAAMHFPTSGCVRQAAKLLPVRLIQHVWPFSTSVSTWSPPAPTANGRVAASSSVAQGRRAAHSLAQTLSFTNSLVHTLSLTPSRSHPLVHTLSLTPSRSHSLAHTLSLTPSCSHSLAHTLSLNNKVFTSYCMYQCTCLTYLVSAVGCSGVCDRNVLDIHDQL